MTATGAIITSWHLRKAGQAVFRDIYGGDGRTVTNDRMLEDWVQYVVSTANETDTRALQGRLDHDLGHIVDLAFAGNTRQADHSNTLSSASENRANDERRDTVAVSASPIRAAFLGAPPVPLPVAVTPAALQVSAAPVAATLAALPIQGVAAATAAPVLSVAAAPAFQVHGGATSTAAFRVTGVTAAPPAAFPVPLARAPAPAARPVPVAAAIDARSSGILVNASEPPAQDASPIPTAAPLSESEVPLERLPLGSPSSYIPISWAPSSSNSFNDVFARAQAEYLRVRAESLEADRALAAARAHAAETHAARVAAGMKLKSFQAELDLQRRQLQKQSQSLTAVLALEMQHA